MPVYTYTAAREIAAGHVAGNQYQIEQAAAALNPTRKIVKHTNRSQGGQAEVNYIRADKFWAVTSDWITGAVERGIWEEFLASVEAGEIFTFDRYGTIAVPDSPINVELVDDSIAWRRVGSGDRWEVSFTLREA